MKKVLSLCVNLLLFITSEAVPLKLIPGDRNVVKKDGATHTISKYYVVPNEYGANNVTNSTEESQETTLREDHKIYSTTFNSGTSHEGEIGANDATNDASDDMAVVKLRAKLEDVQAKDVKQDDDYATEATQSADSVTTEKKLEADDLETESQKKSDYLEIEPLHLQRSQGLKESKLNIPTSLNMDMSDEYNLLSVLKTSTLKHDDNEILGDSISNPTAFVSTNTTKYKYDLPLNLKSGVNGNLPWYTEDKKSQNLPWELKDRIVRYHPFLVEGNLPTTLYQSSSSSLIKNGFKKPYHTYTYVVNPATSIYEIPITKEVLEKKSSEPKINFGTTKEASSQGEMKVVYINKPSASHYKSQFGLSKEPSIEISGQPGNPPLKHESYVTIYKTSKNVNPSNILFKTSQDDLTNQLQYLVDLETEMNPNTYSSESQTAFDRTGIPQLPSHPGSSYSTVSTSAHSSGGILDLVNQPKELNYYDSNNDLNVNQQISSEEDLNSKITQVNEGRKIKYPGLVAEVQQYPEFPEVEVIDVNDAKLNLVSKGARNQLIIIPESSESENTNIINDHNNLIPDYRLHTYEPHLISNVHHSPEHTEVKVVTDYVEPNFVSDGKRNQLIFTPESSESENTNTINDHNYLAPDYSRHTYEPNLISNVHHSPEHTKVKVVTDYVEPNFVSDGERNQLIIIPESSEFGNTINDHNNLTPDYSLHTYDPHLISNVHHSPEHRKVVTDYVEPKFVSGGETNQHLSIISKPTKSKYKQHAVQQEPRLIPTINHYPKLTETATDYEQQIPLYIRKTYQPLRSSPDGYDDGVPSYGQNIFTNPSLNTDIPTYYESTISEYKNTLNDHNILTPVDGQYTKHNPLRSIPSGNDGRVPSYGQNTFTNPILNTDIPTYYKSTKSVHKNTLNNHNILTPVYGQYSGQQQPNSMNVHHYPLNAGAVLEVAKVDVEPYFVSGGEINQQNNLMPELSEAEYTDIPSDYNNPTPGNIQNAVQQRPNLIPMVYHYPELTEAATDYEQQIPLNIGQIDQQPLYTSDPTAHLEYTNVPGGYVDLAPSGQIIFKHPGLMPDSPIHFEHTDLANSNIKPGAVYGGHIKYIDDLPESYFPYKHIDIVLPNLITHLGPHQPEESHYGKHLNLELVPNYQLFTLDNLLKTYDAVIRTIELNGPVLNKDRALINLKKIIELILILAKRLDKTEGRDEWYKKVFYETKHDQHSLQHYVHNLLQQRWLHEFMFILHQNNFNLNILRNTSIFSFLRSWQFPNYVLHFLHTEELNEHNFIELKKLQEIYIQNAMKDKFATGTLDDTLEDIPEILGNYVNNNDMNSNVASIDGKVVFSLAGAKLDAKAIIKILEKYLLDKNFIEEQESVIIRENKLVMLKQIILFLKKKGYNAVTIIDLIRKLYKVMYSLEGKGCKAHHTNYVNDMYDVILPILERSRW